MNRGDFVFIGLMCIVSIIVFGIFSSLALAERYLVRKECVDLQESNPVYWEDNGLFDFGCYIDLNENQRVKFDFAEEK